MRCGACSRVDLEMETGTRPGRGPGLATKRPLILVCVASIPAGRPAGRPSIARVRPAAENVRTSVRPSPPAGQPAPRARSVWSRNMHAASCQYPCPRSRGGSVRRDSRTAARATMQCNRPATRPAGRQWYERCLGVRAQGCAVAAGHASAARPARAVRSHHQASGRRRGRGGAAVPDRRGREVERAFVRMSCLCRLGVRSIPSRI